MLYDCGSYRSCGRADRVLGKDISTACDISVAIIDILRLQAQTMTLKARQMDASQHVLYLTFNVLSPR